MRCRFDLREWTTITGRKRFSLAAWKSLSGLKRFTVKAWCDYMESQLGGASYHADAVHFDGASQLVCASLSTTDSPDAYGFFWIKGAAQPNILWAIDPEGDYLSQSSADNTGKLFNELVPGDFASVLDFNGLGIFNGSWHSVLWSVETDASAGNKKVKVYVDDVDATEVLADAGASFILTANGKSFHLGGDGGEFTTVDIADFRWGLGTSLLTGSSIPEATRRLFVSATNKPVDPSVATAALGAGTILFSGNATSFGTNQGTGGAFTTSGSLTNASTSPSD